MTPYSIITRICTEFEGISPKKSWGETSFFYNPGQKLPNGIYFCTIKEKNGANDQSSNLDRDEVYRLSIGITPKTYANLFGDKPARPAKGQIVATGHDFSTLNQLMPHPVYAWMSWVQILSPDEEMFEKIFPLITEAYEKASAKFEKRVHKKIRQ